jgi:hypothetical protein
MMGLALVRDSTVLERGRPMTPLREHQRTLYGEGPESSLTESEHTYANVGLLRRWRHGLVDDSVVDLVAGSWMSTRNCDVIG